MGTLAGALSILGINYDAVKFKMTKSNTLGAIKEAEHIADTFASKPDRWWLAFFWLAFLLLFSVVLYWYRADQQSHQEFQATVIRQNTEALTRCATALERIERTVK